MTLEDGVLAKVGPVSDDDDSAALDPGVRVDAFVLRLYTDAQLDRVTPAREQDLGRERLDQASSVLRQLDGLRELRPDGLGLTLFVNDGSGVVANAIRVLDSAGIPVGSVSVSQPSLDEVFLRATGSRLESAEPEGGRLQ